MNIKNYYQNTFQFYLLFRKF